jgi:hypothetical protein
VSPLDVNQQPAYGFGHQIVWKKDNGSPEKTLFLAQQPSPQEAHPGKSSGWKNPVDSRMVK